MDCYLCTRPAVVFMAIPQRTMMYLCESHARAAMRGEQI